MVTPQVGIFGIGTSAHSVLESTIRHMSRRWSWSAQWPSWRSHTPRWAATVSPGAGRDLVFDVTHDVVAALPPVAELVTEVTGWSYRHSRDLT